MEPAGGGAAPAFSPEWLACLLGEAEALLGERVSAAVRSRWRREVKLPRMSLEGCLEQLSEARRGREALLARPGPLAEAQQERLQTFLRLEMALLREMQALRERALASAFAVAKKGEPPPTGTPTTLPPPTTPRPEGEAPPRVVSAAEAASQAKAAAQREALAEALWEPGGVGDLIAQGGGGLAAALEQLLAGRLGEALRGLERAVRGEGRARLRQLLDVRGALLEREGGWAERAGALRGEARALLLRGASSAALRRAASALRDCLAEAPLEELRPALETALALLEKTDSWWVAWLEKALWAAPLEEGEAARREAQALSAALQQRHQQPTTAAEEEQEAEEEEEEAGPAALLRALEGEGAAEGEAAPRWGSLEEMRDALQQQHQQPTTAKEEEAEEKEAGPAALLLLLQEGEGAETAVAPRWGSLEEMRDALQSAPFDEVFALLKQPRALRQALPGGPEAELPAVLGALEEASSSARGPCPGAWREQLRALRGGRWETASAALLDKAWALKTEAGLLPADLDGEAKVAALAEELRALCEAAADVPLADREALQAGLAALREALRALPVREALLLRAGAQALRQAATAFWTEPLAEADALLAEADGLRAALAGSALREPLWAKAEELRGALRAIAKKKISVLAYYLWNVLWSSLWKKVGDMQRALWKTPRKEEGGAVQEKLADLEHALDEILEDNLSGLPRILYALPGIVTALQKKVHAVRESLQETPPEMAVALQGKVVAMQEALWKIPFKEAHLMQEDLKAYCLALQRKVEAWWARPSEAAPAKAAPRMEKRDGGWTRRGAPEPAAAPRDAEVGGTGQAGPSSPALPATPRAPNPPTGEAAPPPAVGGAGHFQYLALRAIPHSHFQQRKDWYENTDQDLRDYVVQRLVHAIFPTPDLALLKDHQVEKVVSYAKKVEGDVYQSTNHWDVYCCLIMVKLFKIEKELREKRALRGHKHGIADAQTSPAGPAQPEAPLGSQLAAPEVPPSPTQDPPGVPPLNPMSIWTSPVSLDPLAAPQTSPPAQTHEEEAALTVPASPPWTPQPQSATRASLGPFPSPPSAPGQFLPPHLFPAPLGALDASLRILGESAPQDGGVQGQDPGSPLSHSAPDVAPLPPDALPGPQSQSASLGPMAAAAAPGLSPEPPPQQQPPPPCPKSVPGPGTLGDPHFGTRDAASHGLLGKRRRLAEGGWRASPAGPSPSALPDAPVQPPLVTLESLHRSLEDLRISVLRNLGAVHRQVEALEKRIHTLERWRAEMEGRQQLPPP